LTFCGPQNPVYYAVDFLESYTRTLQAFDLATIAIGNAEVKHVAINVGKDIGQGFAG
jgi:hypothetical protein